MPSSARRREPTEAPTLYAAPPAPPPDAPHDAAQHLLGRLGERLDELAHAVEPYSRLKERGGHLSLDSRKRPYDFRGELHVNVNQYILDNLWRFRLRHLDRGLLDHMAATHDYDGLVNTTQVALARYFECSQPRISKAIAVLRGYHFIWTRKRASYQVNPHYAYRFDSARQQALITRLGPKILDAHKIEIPGLGRNT